MEKNQWMEGKNFVTSREGDPVESGHLGHSYVYHECVPATQNFVQRY
jgi:hypothetical protein